jgi:hypothetical protein
MFGIEQAAPGSPLAQGRRGKQRYSRQTLKLRNEANFAAGRALAQQGGDGGDVEEQAHGHRNMRLTLGSAVGAAARRARDR